MSYAPNGDSNSAAPQIRYTPLTIGPSAFYFAACHLPCTRDARYPPHRRYDFVACPHHRRYRISALRRYGYRLSRRRFKFSTGAGPKIIPKKRFPTPSAANLLSNQLLPRCHISSKI